jgi:lysophospholipase L1-like esterase
MKTIRDPQWFLILMFLAIIVAVPLVQVVVEARQGERPQALDVCSRMPTAASLRVYERNLEDASWAAAHMRPWIQYAQFAWLKDGGAKALMGREGWLFYKPGVQYLTERPRARKATTTADEAVAAIAAFRDELAGRGIQLLVVPAPNKESVYPEKLTRRAESFRGVLCAETQTLLRRLQAAGVEVVDLFGSFAAGKSEAGESSSPALYLTQDSHWSPAGVDLAAKAVAQRILERGWVRPGATEYEDRLVTVERVGDVLRMLQAPQLERDAVPERVPCAQVQRRDTGQPYQDDPDSDVLVLGDSFLRIYEKDEPGAAGFIAHLSKALAKPVASIVNDGGASTLVRQELYRRPALLAKKRLVIWEFVERDIRWGTEGWQAVPVPQALGIRH